MLSGQNADVQLKNMFCYAYWTCFVLFSITLGIMIISSKCKYYPLSYHLKKRHHVNGHWEQSMRKSIKAAFALVVINSLWAIPSLSSYLMIAFPTTCLKLDTLVSLSQPTAALPPSSSPSLHPLPGNPPDNYKPLCESTIKRRGLFSFNGGRGESTALLMVVAMDFSQKLLV